MSFKLIYNIDFNIYFCIIECISQLIKVTDCNNARWKPEILVYLICNNMPLCKMTIGILKRLAVVSQWSDFLYLELRMYDNCLEFHAVKCHICVKTCTCQN